MKSFNPEAPVRLVVEDEAAHVVKVDFASWRAAQFRNALQADVQPVRPCFDATASDGRRTPLWAARWAAVDQDRHERELAWVMDMSTEANSQEVAGRVQPSYRAKELDLGQVDEGTAAVLRADRQLTMMKLPMDRATMVGKIEGEIAASRRRCFTRVRNTFVDMKETPMLKLEFGRLHHSIELTVDEMMNCSWGEMHKFMRDKDYNGEQMNFVHGISSREETRWRAQSKRRFRKEIVCPHCTKRVPFPTMKDAVWSATEALDLTTS
jgi:hypothetical protein